jgi:hypothetical protein
MAGACVRSAWLVLDGQRIDLEDASAGYFCESLDLGSPDVREVTNPVPDANGTIDTTQLFGARVVTVAIKAQRGAGARIDEVAASFAPFMVPSLRPELHYVLDRGANPERFLTLRPKAYSWPVVGPESRDIQMQFVAPDPVAYDPVAQQVQVGISPATAQVSTAGDVEAAPLVRMQGPANAGTASVTFTRNSDGRVFTLAYKPQLVGNGVTFDCAAHTVHDDAWNSVLSGVDWTKNTWVLIPRAPDFAVVRWTGAGGAGNATVTFNDGYLT